ncbi:hypothetical protein Q2490_17665 [Myroides odoratimimus]|uniref:hypothetical protein n=1 Tax=Myroides odoratimimus TaxID=76832 RepID=UPI0026E0DD84|nr:hypothetical protein [Myroides odoratimimus]MDO5859097.1 hypothetical protein [Myroides odoratimimus]
MKEIKIKCNECSEDGVNATFLVIRPSLEHNGIPSRYVGVTIYDANNRTIYGVALNEDQGNGLVHFLQSNESSTYNA